MNSKIFKLLVLVAFVSALLPSETEANPAFFVRVVAALSRWGVRMVKNSYYAQCNTRNLPSGVRCPGVVYGWGTSRNAAQNMARTYAATFGDSACAAYVGHCEIRKLLK